MVKYLGVSLIFIAAFLYGIRYLSAAIYGSNTQSWSKESFQLMLDYVGSKPLVLSWISLISGIAILVYPSFKNRINHELQQIKENWNRDNK